MAAVLLPASLTRLFPGAPRRLDVPGRTVAEVIAGLEARWRGVRDRLCEPDPAAGWRVRRHVNVFVDGERADLDAPVPLAAEVQIIPAVSGGSPRVAPRLD